MTRRQMMGQVAAVAAVSGNRVWAAPESRSRFQGRDLKDSPCEVGDGVMPVAAIFKQLKKSGYRGCVNLEYEINSENPLPGAMRSIGYMKGVLASMAG